MSPRRFAEETEHAAVSARSVVAELPNTPGVYRFRDASERVLYIGRAINLRRRVGSYWTQPDGRLAEMVRRIARIEAVICQSEHEAAWLERNLLEQVLPPWNKTAGGQEVPVFLRLDWQSGRKCGRRWPGLLAVPGAVLGLSWARPQGIATGLPIPG